jgi:photosystem II stability/assembly factor-like uncharacterized protein
MKLISQGTGWAYAGGRILWTTTNGAQWSDISPPNPNDDAFVSVFFLNANDGWVLAVHEIQDDERPDPDPAPLNSYAFSVDSTLDGGKTWTSAPIHESGGDRGLNNHGIVAFSDPLHGWASLDILGNATWKGSTLFATSDGGRTWTPAKSGANGGIKGILPVTNDVVWLIGDEGDSFDLDVSRDGGNSFQTVSFSPPAEIAGFIDPEYELPVFTDTLKGYEAVTYSDPQGLRTAAVLFATSDGGITWKADRILSNLTDGETVHSAVVGSAWILPYSSGNALPELIRLYPKDRRSAPAHESNGDFNRCSLSFLTPNDGWMACPGQLSSTGDGGATWSAISPRARNGVLTTDPITPVQTPTPVKAAILNPAASLMGPPVASPDANPGLSIGVSQKLGFDISRYLSPKVMQTWWNSSPYYDAVFYAPGAPTHPDDPRFTAAWVTAISAQGWGLTPTWSGYQSECACAPPNAQNPSTTYPTCNRFTKQIDARPAAAGRQGTNQADDAIQAFINLGFDGSLAYLDVEGFAASGDQIVAGKTYTCGESVKAYVNGFVQEMHAKGAIAGVYGSASNVTASFLPEQPDEIWIAGGKKGVTVWGQGTKSYVLDDTSWPNKQRIHQYSEETTQSWGGAGPYSVDLDIVDATIYPGSGYKAFSPANLALTT